MNDERSDGAQGAAGETPALTPEQRAEIAAAWKANHLEIVGFAYDKGPDSDGPQTADEKFEAWCHFGVGLNDALRRSMDPEFQPAWKR